MGQTITLGKKKYFAVSWQRLKKMSVTSLSHTIKKMKTYNHSFHLKQTKFDESSHKLVKK